MVTTINGRQRRLHRLVLEAFRGMCPPGHEARHANGVPSDNHLANLSWATKGENERDKRAHGTHRHTQRQFCSRGGHRLQPPNLEAWSEQRGRRKCYSCHWGAAVAIDAARRGEVLDRAVLADQMFAFLMEGGPDPRHNADLRQHARRTSEQEPRPRTALDVVRSAYAPGDELDAAGLLCDAERLGLAFSRNAVQTALARGASRGLLQKVGRGRYRRATHA